MKLSQIATIIFLSTIPSLNLLAMEKEQHRDNSNSKKTHDAKAISSKEEDLNKKLHEAVRTGTAEDIEQIIMAGADIFTIFHELIGSSSASIPVGNMLLLATTDSRLDNESYAKKINYILQCMFNENRIKTALIAHSVLELFEMRVTSHRTIVKPRDLQTKKMLKQYIGLIKGAMREFEEEFENQRDELNSTKINLKDANANAEKLRNDLETTKLEAAKLKADMKKANNNSQELQQNANMNRVAAIDANFQALLGWGVGITSIIISYIVIKNTRCE